MSLFQSALRAYHETHRRRFVQCLGHLELTQRQTLQRILLSLKTSEKWGSLHLSTYEDLVQRIPIVDDESVMQDVLRQRELGRPILCADVKRYEPTSGSTKARKWIPYSKAFLSEINQAASAWLGDMYLQYPGIRSGRHYWSLSWLPEELRKQGMNTDDADLFPLLGRILIHKTMAGSPLINRVPTPEASWWATLLYLASSSDLTMVSVWSPTFLLRVISDIERNATEICKNLAQGSWGRFHNELQPVLGAAPKRKLSMQVPSLLQALWPRLALISAWDSSSSRHWSDELRAKFPSVAFQGKGLWATEGVVTIPFEGQNTLATRSHFFEFRDLDTGEILPSWKLKVQHQYQPLLWTSAGFLRYALPDRMLMTGFNQQTPVLQFCGRLRSLDLVGEKIGTDFLEGLLEKNSDWKGICFLAIKSPQPHYVLLHRPGGRPEGFEQFLLQYHHYKVARELGQLQAARSVPVLDLEKLFLAISKPGVVIGQMKLESVYLMEQLPDFS